MLNLDLSIGFNSRLRFILLAVLTVLWAVRDCRCSEVLRDESHNTCTLHANGSAERKVMTGRKQMWQKANQRQAQVTVSSQCTVFYFLCIKIKRKISQNKEKDARLS